MAWRGGTPRHSTACTRHQWNGRPTQRPTRRWRQKLRSILSSTFYQHPISKHNVFFVTAGESSSWPGCKMSRKFGNNSSISWWSTMQKCKYSAISLRYWHCIWVQNTQKRYQIRHETHFPCSFRRDLICHGSMNKSKRKGEYCQNSYWMFCILYIYRWNGIPTYI